MIASPRSRSHSTVYVAREDREELGRLLNLGDDPSETWLWRVTDHLLFGTSFDEDTGDLLIDRKTIGVLASRSHRSGSFRAYSWVGEYQARTGVVLTLRYANSIRGKARAVKKAFFPEGVDEIADRMRRTRLPISQRVALDTGEPWSPALRRVHRLSSKEQAIELCASAENPDAIRILDLLNSAPSNRWKQVEEHTNELRAVAESLDLTSREYALNVIGKVEVQPMPFFKPVRRTSRIYPLGTTILGLPREVRKRLLELLGWRSLDLRSAQLAIVAHLWEIESLQRFLVSGRSFWTEMLAHLDLDEGAKPFLKDCVYAITFGESERKSEKKFLATFSNGSSLWKLWKSHPLIADLYNARKRVVKEYEKAGGAHDAYGFWWAVEGFYADTETGGKRPDSTARKVAATIAQSYELRLLSPVIDIIERSGRFVKLMYWLHDGFAISVPPSRSSVVREMQEAANAEARRLGILTELVEE